MKITYLSKNEVMKLSILILIAFIIRLYFLQFHQVIETDGIRYTVSGKNLVSGKGYVGLSGDVEFFYPPFYPLMIGLFSFFIENLELVGRIVSIVFGSLLIIPVYLVSKKFYNKKVGFIACLIVIIYFSLTRYSVSVMSESAYLFLIMLGAFVTWLALTKISNALFLISGIIWGLCYLTRPEGIIYPFVISFLVIISFVFCKTKRKKKLLNIMSLFFGFLIVSFPYINYIYSQTGSWSLGGKGGAEYLIFGDFYSWGKITDINGYEKTFFELSEDGRNFKINEMYKDVSILDYIFSSPMKIAKRYVLNLFFETVLIVREFPVFLFGIIGLGFFGEVWNAERLKKELYLIVLLLHPLLIYPFHEIITRFFLPIIPILIIWTANGIVKLQRWIDKTHVVSRNINFLGRFISSNLVLIFILAILLPFNVIHLLGRNSEPENFVEHKEVGIWMKSNLPPNSVIMSRKNWITFYAEGKSVKIPYANYSQVLEYARYKKVDYIIIDERIIPITRPQLSFLLDEANVPEELELVYKYDKSGKKVLVYELKL